MWGANKWTDAMFKKYWCVIPLMMLIYLCVR